MNRVKAVLAHVICVPPLVCHAQQTLPDAPSPTRSASQARPTLPLPKASDLKPTSSVPMA